MPADPRRTRHQFRYQHQLAELRRRDDDELPDADGRAHGAELPLRRHRHRARRRTDPRLRAEVGATIGNFWVDLTRRTLYVLLPLSFLIAHVLVWQGMSAELRRLRQATTLEGAQQTIAQGPVASQEAIKMLGTNGGGFFNANSAHPYENPTPLSNFVQMLSIFLIPARL